MEKMIQVIICRPGKKAYTCQISNQLEIMQDIVDGYIECFRMPYDPKIIIVCNEEGKLKGMENNRVIRNGAGQAIEIIAGTFLIVREGLDGEFASLNAQDLIRYMNLMDESVTMNFDDMISLFIF